MRPSGEAQSGLETPRTIVLHTRHLDGQLNPEIALLRSSYAVRTYSLTCMEASAVKKGILTSADECIALQRCPQDHLPKRAIKKKRWAAARFDRLSPGTWTREREWNDTRTGIRDWGLGLTMLVLPASSRFFVFFSSITL